MKFHIAVIELWCWRVMSIASLILIVYLFSMVGELSTRTVQLAGNQVESSEQLTSTLEALVENGKNDKELWIIVNAMADDYPPKMKLGERSWCKNRSCLE